MEKLTLFSRKRRPGQFKNYFQETEVWVRDNEEVWASGKLVQDFKDNKFHILLDNGNVREFFL